jgi:hypothetical protein
VPPHERPRLLRPPECSNRSSMKVHLGQALPGPPNGLADLESAGGPVASQGPTPHPAAPVPYGPTVPVCGPGRIGSSLHRSPGSYPEGCFDPLVGCSHTPTAQNRTYVLVPHTPPRPQLQPYESAAIDPFRVGPPPDDCQPRRRAAWSRPDSASSREERSRRLHTPRATGMKLIDNISPAPRDGWQEALRADPLALETQSPTWIACSLVATTRGRTCDATGTSGRRPS